MQNSNDITTKKRPRRRMGNDEKIFHLMVLPGLIICLIFAYGPMAGLVMAFQNFNPFKGFTGSAFVGLDNFKYLKRNNAAPFKDGCYVAIIHPDVANDLTNDPEWKAVKQNVDPKDWYKGEIGRIHGVAFIESTEAKIFHPDSLLSDGDTENAELETLTVKSVSSKTITVKEALTADEAKHISGKKVQINGLDYSVSSAAEGEAGSATLTLSEAPGSISADTVIYPSGGGAEGRDVYSTLFIGQNAYGVTSISGGGLQTILKQKGSAGTGDPLDQRSTVGWKATQTAEILSPEFLVRVETTCSY